MDEDRKGSYGQILKSSSIMGGTAGIVMILGLVKTKFAALLIGTAGVGLQSSFLAIQGLVSAVAGLGIASSAVRDVAQAVARDDTDAVGRAVLTLRRMSWLTGLFGMAAMVLLSPLLSLWTFGSDEYRWDIAALGLIILFRNIAGGQTALIQGMRRIGDMARLQIIGAFVATLLAVGFYFWLGIRGIIPALVLGSLIQLVVTWAYAKRIPAPCVEMTWRESFHEAGAMVKLGIAMMWTGLLGCVVTYATIAMITDQFDLQAVGIYNAAYALSGIFVNFVLQAMGTDYYPRLTGLADDKKAMNRLVNEQTEIGLLIAVPGIIATMVFAPLVIQIFYSNDFLPAVSLLHWFILGCFGRIISWPLGYVMLATSNAMWLVVSETFTHLLHVLLIYIGLVYVGLEGVGMAFLALYVFFAVIVYSIARALTNFKWTTPVLLLIASSSVITMLIFFLVKETSGLLIFGLEIAILISMGLYCVRGIVRRVGVHHRISQSLMKVPGMRMLLTGTSHA